MTDTPAAVQAPPPPAAPPAPPSFLTQYAQRIEGLQQQDDAAFQQEQSALAPRYSALQKQLSLAPPKPPDQKPLPTPPDPQNYQQNSMAFFSAMAVLGAVASTFTRTSGTAALGAFAGALKGWKEGNLQAYENASKQWEQATKQTIENNRMVMEKYRQVLENRKLNIDQQMSAIQTIAAQFHDKMTYDAAAAKNYTLVASIYEKNAEFTQRTQDAAAKLQEQRDKDQQKNEQTAAYWLSPRGQAQFQTLDPQQQAAVTQMVNIYGAKSRPKNPQQIALDKFLEEHPEADSDQIQAFIQRGRPQRSAPAMFVQKFMGEHPHATSDDIAKAAALYNETQARARTLGSRGAYVDVAVRESVGAAQQALEKSAAIPRGDWVAANRLQQAIATGTSSPAQRAFGVANASLITAYAQTMSRTGATTVTAQRRAEEVLNTADSQEAYKAGVEQLLLEMKIVQQAVSDVRDAGPVTGGGGGGGGANDPLGIR